MLSSLSSTAVSLFALLSVVSAHTVITYPGWRGDNLHSNGTVEDSDGLGIGPNNTFPYGMQWMYPCKNHSSLNLSVTAHTCRVGGGMPLTENRTLWPVTGGAISVQPGWFQGHATAFFYINLGQGTMPINMSLPMVPVFQIVGPSKQAYQGSFCLPQVPLPAGISPQIGDNATIQVVEAAIHGAALYSVCRFLFVGQDRVLISTYSASTLLLPIHWMLQRSTPVIV